MTNIPNRFPRNDIMSLTEGTPRYDLAESVGPDLLLQDLVGPGDDFSNLALGYGTVAGNADLREVIASRHGVDPDDIVITVGGMHALFMTAMILCRPGDEALIASPLFPNARATLQAVGADIKTLSLSFETGYQLDISELQAQLSDQTKLVCLASPQNPSGVAIPEATLRGAVSSMEAVCPDAFLLIDETYREAIYGDDPVAKSGIKLSDQVISTASLSKCHGAPGLRLGWAITQNAALREQFILGKFNTVISCSAIDEALALRVLERQDTIIGARRKQLGEGLAQVSDWVSAHEHLVDWIRPDAGALCCIRLKPETFDAAAVGHFYDALPGEGVRVGQGAWFGDEQRVFRLGFGLLAMTDLKAGLRGLKAALHQAQKHAA